jgi:hypothetical protein
MTSPDGLAHYRANLTKEVVLKISNLTRTQPEFALWEEIKTNEKLVKCNKDKWRLAENLYYLHTDFEWIYEGRRYKTVSTSFSERQLQKIEECSPESHLYPGYSFLAFHNGQIWATYFGGNYYPRVHLVRVNNKGVREQKWTHVKYLRNFIKCR